MVKRQISCDHVFMEMTACFLPKRDNPRLVFLILYFLGGFTKPLSLTAYTFFLLSQYQNTLQYLYYIRLYQWEKSNSRN